MIGRIPQTRNNPQVIFEMECRSLQRTTELNNTENSHTVFPRISPTAFIKFFAPQMRMRHLFEGGPYHSRPQRPRSFWSAPGIETSGRLQNRKSAIHGLFVKYDKSHWLKNTEQVLCACSEIGSGQRSRFLAQTRRIAASGDENGPLFKNWATKKSFLYTKILQ